MAPLPNACTLSGISDPISSLSHLIAAGLACVAAIRLVRLANKNRGRRIALAVYAFCVVALLSVSGVYHSLRNGPARVVMQHADYLAIWFLIAGTFTAIHGVMCRGFWRRWMLTFVWLYVAAAVASQLIWFKCLTGSVGLLMYLVLGWAGLATVIKVGRHIGFRAMRPLWSAGLCSPSGLCWKPFTNRCLFRAGLARTRSFISLLSPVRAFIGGSYADWYWCTRRANRRGRHPASAPFA